jgi:hypothetical protein
LVACNDPAKKKDSIEPGLAQFYNATGTQFYNLQFIIDLNLKKKKKIL